MRRLALLALRRTLPPWLLAGLLVLLALAARAAPGAETPLGTGAGAGLRALARQDVWSVLLLAAPLLWHLAARTGSDAANAWLAPAPARPVTLAAARLAGRVLAVAAATLATALAAELAVDGASPGWRRVRVVGGPAAVLDGQETARWTLGAVAPGEEARVAVTVAPGAGPATSAGLRAEAAGETRDAEARVAGRTRLALRLPPGSAVTLELRRAGPGALLVLPPDAVEVVAPLASDRGAALALGARAFLLLASAAALAAGLARALRPPLAAGLVVALALAACRAPAALARFLPGADLPSAWADLASGLVPAPPPAASWAGALAVLLVGVLLEARGGRGGAGPS